MNTKNIVTVAILSLMCGIALGYFIPKGETSDSDPSAQNASKFAPTGTSKTIQGDHEKDLNRLRKQIEDLKAQNAKFRKQLADKPPQTDTPSDEKETQEMPGGRRENNSRMHPPSPAEMRARVEELRQKDPEAYTQMTNRFARMRTRQFERAQTKLDILASVDVNRLTPQQRQIHEQYQDLIARQEELRLTAFAPPEDTSVTDEQRTAAHTEMRELSQKLRNAAQKERDILLSQTASSFGLSGETGTELVETIKQVYQATESHGGRGAPPSGAPPPPPGS